MSHLLIMANIRKPIPGFEKSRSENSSPCVALKPWLSLTTLLYWKQDILPVTETRQSRWFNETSPSQLFNGLMIKCNPTMQFLFTYFGVTA